MVEELDEALEQVRAEASNHSQEYASGMRMACVRIEELLRDE